MSADLLLLNAEVVTMDPNRPKAQGVAVKNRSILGVGEKDQLDKLKSMRTEVIDLGGKTILPGFVDAHLHLRALAESLITVDIGPGGAVSSISDIQVKIHQQTQALPPGTWVRGAGYNEVYLTEKRDPNRWEIDAVAPLHPVKLTHRSGHTHVLNSLALNAVGFTSDTPDPEGGIAERDLETGEHTGVLHGLGDFLAARIPALKEDQLIHGVKLADRLLSSFGITSIQDASKRNDLNRWRFFENLLAKGYLQSNVSMMLGLKGYREHQTTRFETRMGSDRLRLGGVKIVLDETTGKLCPDQETLNSLVLSIHHSGWQLNIHAIEETAVKAACIAIQHALKRFPRSDHRHRIEHCSVCSPETVKRISSLGIMVVTNPSFLFFSGERYLQTVPVDQLRYLYPLATLLENNVQLAAGSDAPIASANPLIGICTAATRKSETDQTVVKTEKISAATALRMHTDLAARSSFMEGKRGRIVTGCFADLVVMDANPLNIIPEEIKDIPVDMTVLNGKIVYKR